jgi:hypothetical protein
MNRIAVASGLAAALVLAGAYFGAPYAGLHLQAPLIAIAACLAAGYAVAGLIHMGFARPAFGKAYASSRLNEEPVVRFVVPFKEPGTVAVLAQPGISLDVMLLRNGSMFKEPEKHAGKKVFLTIKKSKKEVFNPVVLRSLFEAIKPFDKSEHMLLVNEHDEVVGYIPWVRAAKEFVGENAETKIRKYILDVLDDPAKSIELRKLDGMGADDIISDTATIHEAARMTWFHDPLHGLVVYSGRRNRKPIGIINKNALLQLIATGA